MYSKAGARATARWPRRAKPGIGRLALESGAPVVPVAILGSHQVRNWKRLRFPRVTVSYGEPLRFERVPTSSREQQQAAAEVILARIHGLHDELERLGHSGHAAADSYRPLSSGSRYCDARDRCCAASHSPHARNGPP